MVRKSEMSWEDAVLFTAALAIASIIFMGLLGMVIASHGWALIPILIIFGLPIVLKYTPLGDKVNSWIW
jgi:hypothetical protein